MPVPTYKLPSIPGTEGLPQIQAPMARLPTQLEMMSPEELESTDLPATGIPRYSISYPGQEFVEKILEVLAQQVEQTPQAQQIPQPPPVPEEVPPGSAGWFKMGALGERQEVPFQQWQPPPGYEGLSYQEYQVRQAKEKIAQNPVEAISNAELRMGQQGMSEDMRMGHRANIAKWMTDAGYDPGAALLYATQGARALPEVAQLLSRQAAARTEEMARLRRMGLVGGLSARRTEASVKRGIADAKAQGKKVAVIIEPDGSRTPIVLDKPTRFLELLYTKQGVIEDLQKGKIPEDKIAIIDMRPTRTLQGGQGIPQGQPTVPTTGPGFTEDEYSGAQQEYQRRKQQ